VTLAHLDWSDAYAVACPVGARIDPQVWADAIFGNAPSWVRGLIAVRQAPVALVGIDQIHNRRGRTHAAVVRLLHPLVVRAVLGRAARSSLPPIKEL